MRALANILITLSLCVGAISGATAYLPPLSLPDEQLLGLRLASPAGAAADESGERVPLVPATDEQGESTRLTAELLADLRAAGVGRVRVKEFDFARWTGRWLFLASCAGLCVGAFLMRSTARSAPATTADGRPRPSPRESIRSIRVGLDQLLARLDSLQSDDEREHALLERLTELLQTHVADFVEARAELIGSLGLAGFASVMDSFSGAERSLNRAWSAAADGVIDEAIDSLGAASTRLDDTLERLGRAG